MDPLFGSGQRIPTGFEAPRAPFFANHSLRSSATLPRATPQRKPLSLPGMGSGRVGQPGAVREEWFPDAAAALDRTDASYGTIVDIK
jgi:hypothetical protein